MTINRAKELNEFIKTNKPDIISLNEIKLNKENANSTLNFTNYKTYYKPRIKNSESGGDVALIVKDTLDHVESNILTNLNLETQEIKIRAGHSETIIVTYYNPPNSKLSKELFHTLNSTKFNYIVCGDLNAKSSVICCYHDDVSKFNNGKILEEILAECSCQVINNKDATFHRMYSGRNDYFDILDLIMCSPFAASKLSYFNVMSS
jgi:exonuclease III